MNTDIQQGDKIVIFGAGLVGSLLAILLAKKGFLVEIHEKRPDLRYKKFANLRSINLALSHRGWRALADAGLEEEMKKIALAMFGRVVHPVSGEAGFQAYGKEDQAIYSISRYKLNCFLINQAESHKNVKINFESKVEKFSFDKSLAYVADIEGLRQRLEAKAFVGSDGAFSALRYEMMREDKFFYQQHYIEHGYKEFTIPQNSVGDWAIRKDGLHIWPRKSFMMIALPNQDKTFTCTLFFPYQGKTSFEKIKTEAEVKALFEAEFPDLMQLIPDYLSQYVNHPVASLVTIRCAPWNNQNFLLIGDAAHAIVPFYGQGMNAGFEDCRILMEKLEYSKNWVELFANFDKDRRKDANAISELALENFVEMRDLISDPEFILRKKLEAVVVANGTTDWIPQYTMVTFSDIPYAEAQNRGRYQTEILNQLLRLENWKQLPVELWPEKVKNHTELLLS